LFKIVKRSNKYAYWVDMPPPPALKRDSGHNKILYVCADCQKGVSINIQGTALGIMLKISRDV